MASPSPPRKVSLNREDLARFASEASADAVAQAQLGAFLDRAGARLRPVVEGPRGSSRGRATRPAHATRRLPAARPASRQYCA
jgi:hypothetical protein